MRQRYFFRFGGQQDVVYMVQELLPGPALEQRMREAGRRRLAAERVLTDFGIGRNIADPRQTTTGPGMVMGTPGYVAPERAISSAALTPACDVYALGRCCSSC